MLEQKDKIVTISLGYYTRLVRCEKILGAIFRGLITGMSDKEIINERELGIFGDASDEIGSMTSNKSELP